MTRLVLQGTEKKLYRLQERDLPDDHDLRGSCLKWVDLSGFDLSAYNCERMDIHDSSCQRVILPDSVDFTVALRSDWTDARIPKSLPFCGWSLVGEVLGRHTAPSGSREAEMIEFVQGLVAGAHDDVRNPWLVANWQFKRDGLSATEIIAAFEKYCFGEYPNLMRMLEQSATAAPNAVEGRHADFMQALGAEGIVDVPHTQLRPFGTEDRWAAARMAEQYLGPGWEVMVFFLVPEVWAVAVDTKLVSGGEWWRKAWPS